MLSLLCNWFLARRTKRVLRSNKVQEKHIVRKAHLIARKNAINLQSSAKSEETASIDGLNKVLTVLAQFSIRNYCPVNGCDSIGHINGIDANHITLSGCPLFHNTPLSYWKDMIEREEGLILENPKTPHTITPNKLLYQNIKMHEPKLDGLASSVHIYQFRRAQQKLLAEKVNMHPSIVIFRFNKLFTRLCV